MKVVNLFAIGLILIQSCHAQNSKPVDWNTDLDYLATELPRKHYNFFTVKSNAAYQADLKKIKSGSSNSTNLQMTLKLQQLIASFGDSHTNISIGPYIDKSQLLPLQVEWFSDGLYVLRTTTDYAEILGRQILSVNGVPLKTIVDSLGTLTTQDNPSLVKNIVPELLPLVQVLEYFGFVKDQKVELGLKDLSGKTSQVSIRPTEMTRANRKTYNIDSLALCYQNQRVLFAQNYLPADKIYYLQYNKCWSRELELKMYGNTKNAEKLPSFKEFEDSVFQTLRTVPVDKIVFDLRFNGGGNSEQGTQFILKMEKYLKENTRIKPYVILGRLTFSSATINAMDLKRLPDVVFVGEETAGKPNHFGEVNSFKLPVSGIEVKYSTKHFKRSAVELNTIRPDVKIEASFADFITGIDPAYEWIRKQ